MNSFLTIFYSHPSPTCNLRIYICVFALTHHHTHLHTHLHTFTLILPYHLHTHSPPSPSHPFSTQLHTHSPPFTFTLTPSLNSSGLLNLPLQRSHPNVARGRHQRLFHLHCNTLWAIQLQWRGAQRTHLTFGEALPHRDLVTSSAKGLKECWFNAKENRE